MHIKGKYNICSLNATEYEKDWKKGGTLEIVKWDKGINLMIQIISPDGDLSTAIVVNRIEFLDQLGEVMI